MPQPVRGNRTGSMTLRTSSLALLALLVSVPAGAGDGWTALPNGRARLVWCGADTLQPASANGRELAFFELLLDPGWKTYWRNPGEAGVAPSFDWAEAGNLASAQIHFPAPLRLPDKGGDQIGYKDRVILPIAVERREPDKPMTLKASISFGVCKNICVPVDLTVSSACHEYQQIDGLAGFVDAVPRLPGQRRATDPDLIAIDGSVTGANPRLTIDVAFGAGATMTDLFIEAPEGLYVPLPGTATPDANGRARFVVDLTKTLDPKDLLGKPLRLTMTSSKGASEAIWTAK